MDPLKQNPCLLLDPFLDGELVGVEAARFEAHLRLCAACREGFEQQRWIDAALRCEDAAELAAPAALLATTADSLALARRRAYRRRLLAGGLAAAATIALLAAWQMHEPIAAPGSAGGSNNQAIVQREATPRRSRRLEEKVAPAVNEQASPPGIATFIAGGNGVAVPLESNSPDVTIVQFYPTVEADRRSRRLRELESKYRELIGG